MTATTYSPEARSQILAALKREAAKDQFGFPQYTDMFDDWVLGRVTRRIRTKLGLAFDRGELTIFNPDRSEFGCDGFVLAYSYRNRATTSVPAEDVRKEFDPRDFRQLSGDPD